MLNLLSTYAIDAFMPIAKWLAVGVVGATLITCLLVFFIKRELFAKVVKALVSTLFIFLLALGITCLIMELVKSYSISYADENWLDRQALIKFVLVPLIVLSAVLLASAITLFLVNRNSPEEKVKQNTSLTLKICGAVCLCALVVCAVLIMLYYNAKIANDGYYNSENASVNQLVLYISSALIVIVLVALAFILDRNKKALDTRCIAMAGICIAMSFGLSFVKLFEMPQGGAVTLFSLFPVMLFSYIYGTKKGVLVCLIYGVLQAVQDPWIIHPAQFFLDYPIAFASIGLTGMFANLKVFEKLPQVAYLLGGIVASLMRFVSHVFSGVFAFSAYAQGVNPWVYSLGYNSFVFVDIAITLVVGVLLLSSKALLKELEKTTTKS